MKDLNPKISFQSTCFGFGLVIASFLATASASSAEIQIGSYGSSSCIPFGCFPSLQMELFQWYSSDQFIEPIKIKDIEFFPALQSGPATYLVEAEFDLYIGTRSTPPALSDLFSPNIHSDLTLFSTFSAKGEKTPAQIVFSGIPFAYNPNNGYLIVNIRNRVIDPSKAPAPITSAQWAAFQTDTAHRAALGASVIQKDVSGAIYSTGASAMVTKINYEPAVSTVPENPIYAMMLTGILGVIAGTLNKRSSSRERPVVI